jgi:carotenoid cleavage dioxygenase-like enzyme
MSSKQPAWSTGVTRVGQEFESTALDVLSGQVPDTLQGTLYRNGPARLQRGDRHVGHWFDGDGAILAVEFNQGQARGQYRFVQTAGYQAEAEAGTLLYGGYGTQASGSLLSRWRKPPKNAANTSVLALDDRLLALWEGGKPHVLDLDTLDTLGLEDIDVPTYSAHPKWDHHSGEIFNFGIDYGRQNALNLFVCDSQGTLKRQGQHPLEQISLIHDFVLAGDYLVFFLPPLEIPLLRILFGLTTINDGCRWVPRRGTQILIFDRHSLTLVSRREADPWFQWHYGNGYVNEAGHIVVDVARYPDFTTNQRLAEIASGHTNTAAEAYLDRLILDPQTANILASECLCDRSCEFPTVAPNQVGHNASAFYLSLHRPNVNTAQDLYGAIGRYDVEQGTLESFDFGDSRYPTEPIYTPNGEGGGWLLTVVYDGNGDRSEVWIFNAAHLDEPVCRLGLPEVIPLGFHGTFSNTLN